MVYVTVPEDLTRIKSKVLFGLIGRQFACFSPAVLVGVPLFFLLKGSTGTSAASFCMISVMLPFFLLDMYKWNGELLEIIAKHFIHTKLLFPKGRPYQTDNFYAVLMRQSRLEKEVKAIVRNKKNRLAAKADPCVKTGN